ncbi:MAG: GAF domain-containing protein [Deltaproteobacteria bacterium]|nr:GAF domain-containing protein [Deltaproteobacteria bacterium]
MSIAQSHDNLSLELPDLLAIRTVNEQCTAIADWLGRQYGVVVLGFLLPGSAAVHAYNCCQPPVLSAMDNPDDLLQLAGQAGEAEAGAGYLTLEDGKPVAVASEALGSRAPLGLIIPLRSQDDAILGVLVVAPEEKSPPAAATVDPAWGSLAPSLAALLQNAVDHEHNEKKIRFLNLYQNVSSALSYIGDLQELLTTIISIVSAELLCEECSVLLYDEENREFEFYSVVGEAGAALEKKRFPADRGIAGRALRERTTQVVNDVQSDPDFYGSIDEDLTFKTRSLLVAPLVSGDELVGVINAVNKLDNKLFDLEDDQILSAIADEVAMAVKNAKLFDFVVNSYCKIRQGHHSCKGCQRPLKSWTPCVKYLNLN